MRGREDFVDANAVFAATTCIRVPRATALAKRSLERGSFLVNLMQSAVLSRFQIRRGRAAAASCAIAAICFCVARNAHAQAAVVEHAFAAGAGGPIIADNSLIMGTDGNLYGTSSRGGAYGGGCVYQMTTAGVITVLHSFSGPDGWQPSGALLQVNDNLLGVTSHGGFIGDGVAYQVSTSGVFTVLHHFDGSREAYRPFGPLVPYHGAYVGGANGAGGSLFSMTPGGQVSMIHSFAGGSDGIYIDGAPVLGKDGNLYGATYAGGATNTGTIYRVTPSLAVSIITSVPAGAAANPYEPLAVDAFSGNLYGISGSNDSVIFKVTPAGAFSIVHTLTAPEGAYCLSGLTSVSSTATQMVGVTTGYPTGPFLFTCDSAGNLTDQHTFTRSEGVYTECAVVAAGPAGSPTLYGLSAWGGAHQIGTVWKYQTGFTLLGSFADKNLSGAHLTDGLVKMASGAILGVDTKDGAEGTGEVVSMDHGGNLTPLGALPASQPYETNNDGSVYRPLITPSGVIIGSADGLSVGGYGDAIYKVGTGEAVNVLNYLVVGNHFSGPLAAMPGSTSMIAEEAPNGTDSGSIVTISANGQPTTLHTFLGSPFDGAEPNGGLTLAGDGNFYGVTQSGGAEQFGTIFRITPGGTESLLHSFTGVDGSYPVFALTIGPDGALYGTTEAGGAYNAGTVFRMTTAGAFSSIYQLNVLDGATPRGALTLCSDGNLYGSIERYNAGGFGGAVFRVSTGGAIQIVHAVNFATEGVEPTGPFVEIAGDLYYETTGLNNGLLSQPVDCALVRLDLNLHDHDFNGDCHPDLLFQNTSTGSIVYWTMNGITKTGSGVITSTLNPQWQLVCSYDLNMDGHPDLLLHNTTTGELDYWLMNGTARIGSGVIATGVSTAFKPICVADLDGTGFPYLLWQNQTNGGVIYWHLNGVKVIGTGTLFASEPANLALVGAADMNGDGYADLLWQNRTVGDVTCTFMSGIRQIGSGVISTGQDPSWELSGAVDLNGDFNPDILWHNSKTGDLVYWYMDHLVRLSGGFIANIATSWEPVER
ncbi:MAG: hypothetical protein KGJ62_15490 [Armatimonadetes bacterium]|nr:hypothetical protein [Armatimonadota bacterium]MDE2207466.1 hypothetical protein [Armatimonadota bacterium]